MADKKLLSLMRAVDTAAARLASGQPLSINEIAAAAQCSTSTIYDAFPSKKEFLVAVMERCHQIYVAPLPLEQGKMSSFDNFISFLVARISFLNSPHIGNVLQIKGQSREADDRISSHMIEGDPLADTIPLIAQLVTEGYLPDRDPHALAFMILSAVSYEPFILNVWHGRRVHPFALLKTVLDPLLTELGRTALTAFLGQAEAVASDGRKDDPLMLIGMHRDDRLRDDEPAAPRPRPRRKVRPAAVRRPRASAKADLSRP